MSGLRLLILLLVAGLVAGEPVPTQVELKVGALRLVGQPWKLSSVPPELAGLRAYIVDRGARSDAPGQGFRIHLDASAAVYLAVHRRGRPTIPERWQRTGLALNWGNFQDDVYVTIAEPGELLIPPHDGEAGLFGVPHLVAVSPDLVIARKLIAAPRQAPPPPARPAELRLRVADGLPGLYALGDEELAWRFQLYREPAAPVTELRVRIRDAEAEGPALLDRQVAMDGALSEILRLSLPAPGLYVMEVEAAAACNVTPLTTGLARIRPPRPPSASSAWGVMRAGDYPQEGALARRLGVSWLRHTTWATGKLEFDDDGKLRVDFSEYVAKAHEYHDLGINIMGDIQWVPRALSSQPDATRRRGDAGPEYLRVPPRDYAQWRLYVQELVRQTRPMIRHWEIGNEPNTPHHYWAGTGAEFAEFVKHTGDAIRDVDPDAQIILAGFTLNPDGPPFLAQLLDLGCAPYLDILSVHSLYGKARTVEDMRAVLARHGLANRPIWSTEPKHELPIRNFAAGIAVNMHFLLMAPGPSFYSQFRNLSTRGGGATRPGVIYANAARIIGDAAFMEELPTGTPDAEAGLFARGEERLLAVNGDTGPRNAVLVVDVEPLAGEARYTDGLGRECPLPAGRFAMPLDRSGFIDRARDVNVIGPRLPQPTADHGIVVGTPEADLRGGFKARSDGNRPHYAAVWTTDPGPEIRFPITVETAGTYEIYTVIQWADRGVGRLVSPFSWQFDNRPATPVRENLTMHWRDSTRDHLRFSKVPEHVTDTALGRQLYRLGVVRHIKPGPHTLTIRLDAPRSHDAHYNMEVEQIVLRPITDDRE